MVGGQRVACMHGRVGSKHQQEVHATCRRQPHKPHQHAPGSWQRESMISSRRWRLEMASSLSTSAIMVMATIWEV